MEEIDIKETRIKELEQQVKSLENFANVVVAQRNEALNDSAKYQAQLMGKGE